MKVLYHGFDKLEVSFEGAVSGRVLEQLEDARQKAEVQDELVAVKIGKHERLVQVEPRGVKGGFRYIVRTGEEDLIFFIKNSHSIDQFNIKVSVQSYALCTKGYKQCLREIEDWFDIFSVKGEMEKPLSSFARVDYCIDILMPKSFAFVPLNFVQHARSKTKDIYEIHRQANCIRGVTIGKMPNKQIGVYDKSHEVKEKDKEYWWDIWQVSQNDLNGVIWRIELRAGKEFLKKSNTRTLDDFFSHIGNVFQDIHRSTRYTVPNEADRNRSRWENHLIWNQLGDILIEKLGTHTSKLEYTSTMPKRRSKKRKGMMQQIAGLYAAISVLDRKEDENFEETIRAYTESLIGNISENISLYEDKIHSAKDRYAFICT